MLTIITADLISYAPIAYLMYIYFTNGNSTTFTSDQWYQFGGFSIIGYLAQLFLILIVDIIAIFSLTE